MLLDLGLLIIRLVFGLSMASHGCEKLFGWFGGYGIKGNAQFFESIGLKPGIPLAIAAGLAELLGGLFLAAGVYLGLAALLIIGTMLVATVTVTGQKGFNITSGGFEYNLAIIAVAVGIYLTGPGNFALF